MNHQDWNPVILTKKTKPNTIITPKTPKEDEEFDIPKINADLKNKIQQGRIAKKLSQAKARKNRFHFSWSKY